MWASSLSSLPVHDPHKVAQADKDDESYQDDCKHDSLPFHRRRFVRFLFDSRNRLLNFIVKQIDAGLYVCLNMGYFTFPG